MILFGHQATHRRHVRIVLVPHQSAALLHVAQRVSQRSARTPMVAGIRRTVEQLLGAERHDDAGASEQLRLDGVRNAERIAGAARLLVLDGRLEAVVAPVEARRKIIGVQLGGGGSGEERRW